MFNKFILGVIILVLFSCSNSTEPRSPRPDEFSRMEIHYTVIIGLAGATSKLDIFGDGTVQKSSDSDDFKTSLRGTLTTTQRDSLIQLFSNFSQYDSEYIGTVADGDDHIIDYIYAGKTETTRVYAPENANIPESLRNIISYLHDLRVNLILN